jgi:8-amino-7-oxononanoate synthase
MATNIDTLNQLSSSQKRHLLSQLIRDKSASQKSVKSHV